MEENMAPEGSATTVKTTFSRETAVSITIRATAATVWRLLTNAANYPAWNSTVISIAGDIALGQAIQLKSTLDPKRVFKLTVKKFEAEKELVWGDNQGQRTYTITNNPDGSVRFAMTERIGGLLFPLFSKYIPPFDQSFEQFAADLKKAAEAG
jgi:uncharacterized protein YndB with AHSA1/START domain